MNRMALVRRLAHEPQSSRANLAVGLGLTKSTVGLLVKDLVEEGLAERKRGCHHDSAGVLHVAPNMGWRNVPVASLVRAQVEGTPLDGLPLFVQSDADVAALAEFEFVGRPETDALVCLRLIGGADVCASALLNAEKLINDGAMGRFVAERCAGWQQPWAREVLDGKSSRAAVAAHALARKIDQPPVSGRQEHLENLVNRYC
jgi:hypothetical protein